LVAFDVDGTLTDGSILIGPDGEAMKRFSVRDGFGLSLLRRSGLKLAIITARQSAIVALRAGELRFDHVLQGVADKRQALAGLCERERLQPHETAFMGDDWPDLGALGYAGLAAAVSDAAAEVQARAHWVGTVPAGRGAVREFAEWLLRAQGRWETLLGEFSR
jgi:3-deoxy-D-manno-octulosonate 8-phosphate phosphatase (KDO 8-P phosphatase)